MTIKEIGEFGLIERIKAIVEVADESLVAGIGDDAAVIKSSGGNLTLVSTDSLLEGIHFDLSYFTFFQIGWRAAAANLSDIAAMGGTPQYLLVSIALPANVQPSAVEEIYRGANKLCSKFKTIIVGGDTTLSPHHLYISMTIIGQVEKDCLALRSGANPGDGLFVTGNPGESHAGLRVLNYANSDLRDQFTAVVNKHLSPEPRVSEARFLVNSFPISAMIDISDGVTSEMLHLCRQSGVGVRLLLDKLPITSQTLAVSQILQEEATDYALNGGEDFELLFTAPLGLADELTTEMQVRFNIDCTCIGEVGTAGEKAQIVDSKGNVKLLTAKGWEHFR